MPSNVDQIVENLTTVTAAAHGIPPPSTQKPKKREASSKPTKSASADSGIDSSASASGGGSNGAASGGAMTVTMKCEGEGDVKSEHVPVSDLPLSNVATSKVVYINP